ncbi:MAG: hypothetical protein CML13_14960 [Puniceicoccaceae bacterium]|nr:hypothetical protein [Puniceicoccaceae bacterium]|tara:strand:- start:10914 stop:11873 length:960 start_codon:yes stop_codon:yes gene_type:complete
MLPYLHILIRVEDDGSLHALGAFTSKEKQLAYQKESGLKDSQVRLDFFNGPFDEDITVIYAGHRRWNMDLFQLGGYFKSEGEAWTWVTQEGYVSVLPIDTTYEEEKALQKDALDRYAKLQRRWRLATYEELVNREGADKARANIKLRFYEDALESFKPKTRRDLRALYAFVVLILCLPLAVFYFLTRGPEYGENVDSVSWLPSYTSDISYYRSNQVQVFEFKVSSQDFKRWAESRGMSVRRLITKEIISRYKAYIPPPNSQSTATIPPGGVLSVGEFESWQDDISAKVEQGLIAESPLKDIAIYDNRTQKAYYEFLINF